MSLPANVLVIPLASILMPAAVLAVALSYVSFWLAHLPALVAGYALAVLTGTIRIIGHFRISDVRLPVPDAGDLPAGRAGAGTGSAAGSRDGAWLAWVGVAGLLAAALGSCSYHRKCSGIPACWKSPPSTSARAIRC